MENEKTLFAKAVVATALTKLFNSNTDICSHCCQMSDDHESEFTHLSDCIVTKAKEYLKKEGK